MRAQRAEFITSAAKPSGFPPPELPELAVAGRSNVGKSSLINTLVGVPKLARTSNTPGRTRLINWFRVEPQKGKALALVDLPGYGYAKVSRDLRREWQTLIEAYFDSRPVLRGVLVLIDSRRGAEDEERDLLEFLASRDIDTQVVMTKADKLPKSKRKLAAMQTRKQLGLRRDPILSSIQDPATMAEIWRFILR